MAVVKSLDVLLRAATGKFNAAMQSMASRFRAVIASMRGSSDKGATGIASLGSSAVRTIAGLTGLSVGVYGVQRALRSLVSASEEFQQAMASSTAIMTDLSDVMRNDMVAAAQKVAFHTKFSSKEAAEAFYFLSSAGLTAKQSIESLPAVATFAQAGMFNLSRATELLADSQSAMGLKTKDAARNMQQMVRVSDVLVRANTLANASVEQFATALTTKSGAALRMVNKTIEEGVAVLAAMADQGIKGEEAGTALGIALRNLSTAAITNKDAFLRFGIAVFDTGGRMRKIADIVSDFERRMLGVSDETKRAMFMQLGFGDKALASIQALLGTSEKIRAYEIALRRAGGFTEMVADRQMPKLTKALHQLGVLWELAANEFVPRFVDALGSAEEPIKRLIGWIAHLADTLHVFWSIAGIGRQVKEIAVGGVTFDTARIVKASKAIKAIAIGRTPGEKLQDAYASLSGAMRKSAGPPVAVKPRSGRLVSNVEMMNRLSAESDRAFAAQQQFQRIGKFTAQNQMRMAADMLRPPAMTRAAPPPMGPNEMRRLIEVQAQALRELRQMRSGGVVLAAAGLGAGE